MYGTVGFQAPEIAELGPSIPSDLYTVGRTLTALILDFKGNQSTYRYTLPPPEEAAVFRDHESLYRFLLKSTARQPDERFQSAEEMSDQLVGVLRQIVAAADGSPRPAPSTAFTSDFRDSPDHPDWRALPALRVSGDDPAAAFLATITVVDTSSLIDVLSTAPVQSVEVTLRLARTYLDASDGAAAAARVLDAVAADDPWDWRVWWYRGLMALAADDPAAARTQFERVYADLPGELAPRLALAVSAERIGDLQAAAQLYDVVATTDPAHTTACFGLARCRLASGDRLGAVAAYNRVPELSSSYLEAQVAAARALVDPTGTPAPGVDDLTLACTTVDRLALDGEQRAGLSRDLFDAALMLLDSGQIDADPSVTVLGEPLTERRMRCGLERSYRALARLAATAEERIRLVDQANEVRPRSLV